MADGKRIKVMRDKSESCGSLEDMWKRKREKQGWEEEREGSIQKQQEDGEITGRGERIGGKGGGDVEKINERKIGRCDKEDRRGKERGS